MLSRMLVATIISVSMPLGGCAYLDIERASMDDVPKGIRVYDPRIYLFVDKKAEKSVIVYAPNFKRAYDINPVAFLSKHDFAIEVDEGQLKKLTSNRDTTAILNFFQGSADVATKAAGMGVSSQKVEGTFGLDTGIYEMNTDGKFLKQ